MNYASLSEGLRSLLKTRNITYKEIANKLDMSESGVKKMLTADDIGYNKLNSILELLEIRIEDLTLLASKPYKELTEEQEKFFEKNPRHFNFFIQLHHHKMSVDHLKKANNKLSKKKISQYLADLEGIDIIKTVDGKTYSLLEDGFRASSKFNERFRRNYDVVVKSLASIKTRQWKTWMFEGFGTFSLTQDSALELRNEIQTLFDEFSSRSEREKKSYEAKDLINTGTLFVNIPMKIKDVFPIV